MNNFKITNYLCVRKSAMIVNIAFPKYSSRLEYCILLSDKPVVRLWDC